MSDIYQRPAELLQNLIRFDTTNPPGNEAACIGYIRDLLAEIGVETQTYAKDPNRPNLMARLKGQGNAPPLLLYGHVDVVTTANQTWTHPPFSAEIADGFLWGRGALDMKHGVAMLLSVFMRAKVEGLALPGDLVFLAVSDEEAGGDDGAKFMVEQHPDLFKGIRYAIGEFGGFSMTVGGRKFYPIQISEKQICWLKGAITGPGGHGALRMRGGVMAKMARVLQKLDENRLPVHVTPAARFMFEALEAGLDEPMKSVFHRLLDPSTADAVLDELGTQAGLFDPVLHNTVNATMVQGGSKVNVIPGEVTLNFDGRMLPGYTPDDLIKELHDLLDDDIQFEVIRYESGAGDPDMGLFDTLAGIMKEADPDGTPIPFVVFGGTDGRHFSQIGIQTYGFLPTPLPADFNFLSTIHAANERIPVGAMEFGTDTIYKALQRFGG